MVGGLVILNQRGKKARCGHRSVVQGVGEVHPSSGSRWSRSDALRELLPHHREAGASIGDAMQTLLHLAARAESWSVEYTEHHELVDLVCALVDD